MMQPLQMALFPICMSVWNTEGKKATQDFLSRSLDQFILVAVAVVCVAIVTSRDVIVLLASRKFQEAHTLLPFLVIGLVLSAVTIYFRPGLMIHKRAAKIAAGHFLRQYSQYRAEYGFAAPHRPGGRRHRHHRQLWRHCRVSSLPIASGAAVQARVCCICALIRRWALWLHGWWHAVADGNPIIRRLAKASLILVAVCSRSFRHRQTCT